MADDQDTEPKQRTPKGVEIPVPSREEWERNMGKVLGEARAQRKEAAAQREEAADQREEAGEQFRRTLGEDG